MRISLMQTDVIHGDPAANLGRIEELFPQDPGDLVVLPELATTGYIFETEQQIRAVAESPSLEQTLARFTELAARYDTTIVVGLAEPAEGSLYNSVFVVGANGLRTRYRKRFLAPIDRRYFSRGDRLGIFEVGGVRVGLLICFDIWFPELCRAYLRAGVDLFVHGAAFGGPQTLALGRARALENGTPVVTCNRVGAERDGDFEAVYRGQSQVIDRGGHRIQRCSGEPEVATCELDLAAHGAPQLSSVDLFEELEIFSSASDR